MAIQFARCQYVSRSTGGNACRKASYNQRETVKCERTGEVFSFKERGGNIHHEILLPEGADEGFKNSSVLWNEVEKAERRKDSQVAKEFVIALPDDEEISLEDRIELTRRFAQLNFVDKGVAAQLDIHAPHDAEKNWHAHLLVTTRRFSEDGKNLSSLKARDLDPIIRSKNVVEADIWGEIWRDLQNQYFEEKGYALRVDPIGIVPQEHLGPVRMRHHMNEALQRSVLLQKANEQLAQDPQSVLEEVTRHKAVFSQNDIDHFLQKHVPFNERQGLLKRVLGSSNLIELYDKETGEKVNYFTTEKVRLEEEKLLRFAEYITRKENHALPQEHIESALKVKFLSAEQREAYELCVSSGKNLCLIQGRAGVGKSYVLDSIRRAHELNEYRVLGLAPTHKVAMDLKESGFKEARTCHSFLFALKNNRETIDSRTIVILDEAGMLGTEVSVELFNSIKSSGAKLILVGDDRQLSSVERGGAFSFLAERYGAVELKEVRRQTIDWQKQLSEDFSKGNVKSAINLLQEKNRINWAGAKEEALAELLKAWARDMNLNPQGKLQILAHKNVDVDALNQGARDLLRQKGKLGDIEISCMTQRGRVNFAAGDRVHFTQTDKAQGIFNGSFGVIEDINKKAKRLIIKLDNDSTIEVDLHTYTGLRHGYASTVYKAQGATLDHVYVLHSKSTNQSVSYVALTRQTKSLSLYVSQQETPTYNHLIRQMSREEEKGTSLIFHTKRDIQKKKEAKSLTSYFKAEAEKIVTKLKDTFHRNEGFYQFDKPQSVGKEEVTLKTPDQHEGNHIPSQDKVAVEDQKLEKEGSVRESRAKAAYSMKTKEDLAPTKYKATSIPQNNSIFPSNQKNKDLPIVTSSPFIDARMVENALKQNMARFADEILSSIGEEYNRATSSATERRYGKKGHIAVNLRTGAWINHKESEMSGGPLHLLTKIKGLSFKEAIEYGAAWAGIAPELDSSRIKQSIEMSSERKIETDTSERGAEERQEKIKKAQSLWENGQPIQGTIAEKYLKEHRKIQGELPKDLRFLPNFKEYSTGESYSCLMAAARSKEGEVTAIQLTFLNPETAAKADLPVTKKSFGVLKGSFVMLQEGRASEPIFVAEGVETALSVKEGGFKGTIKASLGLSNIKQIIPKDSIFEKTNKEVIICADHDAPDSPAFSTLGKSILALQEGDLLVTVVKPTKLGEDFNDILKREGAQAVKDCIDHALNSSTKQLEGNISPSKMDEEARLRHTLPNNEDYSRFKFLTSEMEKTIFPDYRLKEERQTLGLALSQHKEWIKALKQYDEKSAKSIESIAQENELEQSLAKDKGGLSK